MLDLRSATSMPTPGLLDAPGGFSWWYADLLDAAGNGLVLVWSFGLPFLPGVARAARGGSPPPARSRPSVNLAIYEGFRPAFYLLQELGPEDAAWDGADTWRFGRSTLRRTLDATGVHLTVDVDLALPAGGEVRGTIDAIGRLRTGGGTSPGPHEWAPVLAAGRGTADLSAEGRRYRIDAPAYHDRNAAPTPLHTLGFRRWCWGRAADGDDLVIWYVLWPSEGPPETHVLRVDPTGATERVNAEARLSGLSRGWMGMPRWRGVTLLRDGARWMEVSLEPPVDDGPFYVRQLGRATLEGRPLPVVAEVCEPDRIDRLPFAPLVQMAVHRATRPSSMWAPLFAGPRVGRFGRLLRSWGPRRPEAVPT